MPIEITEAEDREYRRYKELGTPSDLADKAGKVAKLEKDNHDLREERRELRGKTPAEGSVVLAGEDAKRWDAYNALNKTPEELAAGLVLTPEQRKEWEALEAAGVKATEVPSIVKERDELKQKDAQRAWTDGVAALARAEGIPDDSVPALAAILRALDPNAVLEVKPEKTKDAAGVEVEKKVGYVTLAGKQATKFSDLRNETAELKGIRIEAGETGKTDDGNRWFDTPVGGSTGGGYDPVKAGKAMAEAQKAAGGTANLALT